MMCDLWEVSAKRRTMVVEQRCERGVDVYLYHNGDAYETAGCVYSSWLSFALSHLMMLC
jgi:hypothetical protein